jgi:hypothetical protein
VSALTIQAEDFSICAMEAAFETALTQPPQPPPPPGAPPAPSLPGNEFNVGARDANGQPWQMGKPLSDVFFDMKLRGALVDTTFHPNFNLGLPVLGLKLMGGLNVSLTYEIHLIVGMDQNGLYINTGPSGTEPEAKLSFAITAQPGLVFEGTLGFLRIKSVDAGTAVERGTGLTADLFVDLQDGPDADTKLRWSEVPSLGLNMVKEVAVQGNAHVNMLTTLDLGSANFPALSSTFFLDWNFPRTNLLDPGFALSKLGLQAPLVEFKNVTLDAGSFMSRFLSPVLKTMNDVLDPNYPALMRFVNAMRPFSAGYDPDCRYVEASRYASLVPDDMKVLERAFERFNIGTDDIAQAYRANDHRSLSTGDIVTIDGKAFYCASFGWTDVPNFKTPASQLGDGPARAYFANRDDQQ